jgi:choline kinase
MARSMPVWTFAANGLQWCEVDFPADLKQAHRVVRAISASDQSINRQKVSYAWG